MATSQIATNMSAVLTHNVFAKNNAGMSAALGRVSTGLKINSAKDNASQYAISEKMLERINSNQQASQNVQNDNALMKTAEDGIANTVSILKTLKARALDAANDANNGGDRQIIQKEVDKLIDQINDNADNVKYNGKTLLDGTYAETVNSATKSAAFTELATDISSKKLSEYFGAGLTAAGGITATLTWTKASGEMATQTGGNFNSGHTLAQILTSTDVTSGAGFTITSTAAGAAVTTDKNGSSITALTDGFSAVATNAGRDKAVGGITLTINGGKGYSKTFVFSELQAGKDVNSSSAQALTFQVGEEASFKIDNVNIENMKAAGLGVGSINVTTKEGAQAAISSIDTALNRALAQQTTIGAIEQRLGFTADSLDTINENLQASNSAIRDADLAKDISDYMKYSVLSQSAQYMLAQSHQNAFQVLNLLQ